VAPARPLVVSLRQHLLALFDTFRRADNVAVVSSTRPRVGSRPNVSERAKLYPMTNDHTLQAIALIGLLSSTMACANAPGTTGNTATGNAASTPAGAVARVQPEYDERGKLQKLE